MSNLKVDFSKRADFPKMEEQVLEYWDEVKAFEKSVEQRPEDKPYVFYDGPPFATGLPHYGHLLGSIMKDIVPRYWTMKGYRVERVWGWDCHGLPIENIVEQELGLEGGKKGIEELGVDKFNAACRKAIWKFDKEWEKIIPRIGRWVDFKNSYKTMDTSFMESVWWAFKQLSDKGLVYEGRKVILYCPRCSTPLSNFEIAMDNSYKDVKDHSITIKFKLTDPKQSDTYLLAWTTTPWTLIGNVALAVHPDEPYVKVSQNGENYILAESRLEVLEGEYEIVEKMKGNDLKDLEYEPLYKYLDTGGKKAHYVAVADFVSMSDGTGIVHTAAMYGEDDFNLAQKLELPLVDMLDDQGKFMDFVEPISGYFYKKAEKWVNQDLEERGLMYKREDYIHSYPHCYRCSTPLYYTGIPAWFIDIQKVKDQLVEHNKNIDWFPGHLKQGRFGKGLETAPDWNISRSRYWGTPIPIWRSEEDGRMRVIGSIEELRQWAVEPSKLEGLDDIHREYIDDIEVWVDNDKTVKGRRIPEVFDCWVESGSMPFASEHYPFENKDRFAKRQPAQYICEYIAQTRAWFYTLHVMSVALFDTHTFENALTTGTIMATDGSKMSKSKRNFTDPMLLVDKYGVDSLRLYFASSPVMKTAENVNFSEDTVDEIRKKVFNIFWNVFAFYKLYDGGANNFEPPENPEHVLDKWLLSRTEKLTKVVRESMDAYDVVTASRELMEFVNDFSTWWLRLSRDRLKEAGSNQEALVVFRHVLKRWCLLMAPFAPFFTEMVYQNLVDDKLESVHLELLPQYLEARVDPELEEKMVEARKAVEKIHSLRKQHSINTRQPLSSATITSSLTAPKQNLLDVIGLEVNVKQVNWKSGESLEVTLDLELTDQLKAEGEARELVRQIQQARKNAGMNVDDKAIITLPFWPKEFEEEIMHKVGATRLIKGDNLEVSQE